MGSANPITAIADPGGSIVQIFRAPEGKLAVDIYNLKGQNTVVQSDNELDPYDGHVAVPGSISALTRYGLPLVYGVYNLAGGEPTKPVLRPVLSQLSPSIKPVMFQSTTIPFGDNKSVAVAGSGDDWGWVYNIDSKSPKLIEYKFDYRSTTLPTKATLTVSEINAKTRLGAVAFRAGGTQYSRAIVWQNTGDSIMYRVLPNDTTSSVAVQDAVLPGTPISVTASVNANVVTLYIYYLNTSHRLCRAKKEGDSSWILTTVLPNDTMDNDSDLAVAYITNVGNVYNVLYNQNGVYTNQIDTS